MRLDGQGRNGQPAALVDVGMPVTVPLLAALQLSAAAAAPLSDGASRQAALVRALVEVGEAERRAGRLDECLRVLDGGAALVAPTDAQPADRTRLALQRARCAYYKAALAGAPHDDAIRELSAVVAQAEAVAEPLLLADARDLLGLALYARDIRRTAHDEARSLFEQALAARRSHGDRRGEAETLFHLGLVSENRNDPSPEDLRRARARHEEALSIARAGGFEIEASYALRHLAGHQQEAGDLDGAVAGFEESLRLRERSGYRIYVPPALLALGDAWKQKGDLSKARSLYERALADAEAIGAERFRSAARDALAGLDAAPSNP
jgi:tetratricopeptide (TPR) repeat protein